MSGTAASQLFSGHVNESCPCASCMVISLFVIMYLQGDSGFPLMAQQGSVWIQAGVASFGCVETNYPEVFTRVSRYEDWINFTISNDQPCFVTFLSNGTESNNGTCTGVTPTPTSTTPCEWLIFLMPKSHDVILFLSCPYCFLPKSTQIILIILQG